MEGIVAGVSSLAGYDVIIDAGSSGADPENAVPFDLQLPNGKTLKQPGNFMFQRAAMAGRPQTASWGGRPSTGRPLARGAEVRSGPGSTHIVRSIQDCSLF
jgi:hypothetical protein